MAARNVAARAVSTETHQDRVSKPRHMRTEVGRQVLGGKATAAVCRDPSRFESTLHGLAYPSSKAALNMITSQYAKAFPRLRINAADPGYTATDLNNHRGTKTVEQSAEIIVRMATIGPDGPTGTFVDEHGTVPW
jgi:NAD(P)-dependent dehydrogenase (short-subunit alcohol dehydrogenase family)